MYKEPLLNPEAYRKRRSPDSRACGLCTCPMQKKPGMPARLSTSGLLLSEIHVK